MNGDDIGSFRPLKYIFLPISVVKYSGNNNINLTGMLNI